ncbi:unnamed protein product [Caenorhabditis auriculariae]|uniref:G-protein coupled receptors family 1 profile domain-containing protein n=1 Tax=Caenorhabditis auriculariae TaxID=2777116 RepID=A0A8S1GTX5_9PELO|nr:unnamed protein product [Caenorhabditis auriculariae]
MSYFRMTDVFDATGPTSEFEIAFFGFSALGFNDSVYNAAVEAWETVCTEEFKNNPKLKGLPKDLRLNFATFPFKDAQMKHTFERFMHFCATTHFRIPTSVVLEEHLQMHRTMCEIESGKMSSEDILTCNQEYNRMLEHVRELRTKLAKLDDELEELNATISVLHHLEKAREQLKFADSSRKYVFKNHLVAFGMALRAAVTWQSFMVETRKSVFVGRIFVITGKNVVQDEIALTAFVPPFLAQMSSSTSPPTTSLTPLRDECAVIVTSYNVCLSFVFILCFLLSLLGNAVVIITILGKSHRSRSITNFYLLNLAFADLLRSVVCIPTTLLSELTHCWLLGAAMCKIVAFMQPVGVCASAYTLAVIAVERYYAICRPLQSRKWHTKKRALVTIFLVWCFSFSANLGSLFVFDAVPIGSKYNCDSTQGRTVDFVYQLYLTFALLFVPLALMVGLYGNVIFTLNTAINSDHPTMEQQLIGSGLPARASFSDWLFNAVSRVPSLKIPKEEKEKSSLAIPLSIRSSRPSRSFSSFFTTPRGSIDSSMLLRSTNQEKILIAKKKVTRMLITLVIVFAFCWVPSYVWWIAVRMADLTGNNLWHSGLNSALTILTYVSSLANPITYCFMNKSFRASVISHCTWCAAVKRPSTCSPVIKKSSREVLPPTPLPIIRVDLALDSTIHI